MENFAFGLGPYAFLALSFAFVLAIMVLGFFVGRHLGPPKNEAQANALNTALAAVFVIVGLVLSFSFSFAVNRYEERWHLVVAEAQAVSTTWLRCDALPASARITFQALLAHYLDSRLRYYENPLPSHDERQLRSTMRSDRERLWTIVSSQLVTQKTPAMVLLAQSTDDLFDRGDEQEAALGFRLQGPALAIIVFVALVAAFMIGLGFGQSQSPHWLVSVIFCLLLAGLLSTIVDLDNPKAGLIRLNLEPLIDARAQLTSP